VKSSPIVDRARSRSHLDLAPEHRPPSPRSVVTATILSVGLSLLADALLVVIGTAIFPSTKGYVHFRFVDYSRLTIVGVIVACLAWPVVTRLTSTPRWLFFRLALLVTVVLLVPDGGIWARGASDQAVLVLVAMHFAIALVTYNLLVRLAPVRPLEGHRPAPRTERVH
jgi:hypothetical protein